MADRKDSRDFPIVPAALMGLGIGLGGLATKYHFDKKKLINEFKDVAGESYEDFLKKIDNDSKLKQRYALLQSIVKKDDKIADELLTDEAKNQKSIAIHLNKMRDVETKRDLAGAGALGLLGASGYGAFYHYHNNDKDV